MDEIQKSLLEKIADIHEVPEGAYNIRSNGQLEGRNTTANIDIVTKKDEPGIVREVPIFREEQVFRVLIIKHMAQRI